MKLKDLLAVPNEKKVVICMAFGKPEGRHVPKSRKAVKDFVFLNKYGRGFGPLFYPKATSTIVKSSSKFSEFPKFFA
jgi:hypothetical protein